MKITVHFFLILFTCFVFGFFSLFYIDGAHDGIVLMPALEVLKGKILFKETFTQYGALFTWVHAVGLRLFGEHVLSLRLMTLLAYALTAVVLWESNRRFLPFRWNMLAFLLWISLAPVYWWFFHSWSSVFAALFQCLSALLAIRYIESRNSRYLVFSGVLASLVFWFRQPVGITHMMAMIGVIGILFFRSRLASRYALFLFGAIAGSFPILLILFLQGSLQDWWLQSMVMQVPFAQETRGISFVQLLKSLLATRYWRSIHEYWIWIALPLSSVLVFCVSFYTEITGKASKLSRVLLVLSGASIASWHQYYPVTERLHFFWAATPMIGIFVYLLYRLKRSFFPFFLFLVAMNVALSFWHGIDRVKHGVAFTDRLSIIRGVPVTKEFRLFIEDTYDTMDAIFRSHPDLTYINDTNIAFYQFFHPERFHAFRGVYVNWGRMTSTIYPDLPSMMEAYVKERRPLVFTRTPEKYEGYCDTKTMTLEDPPVYLLAPKELGGSINCEEDKKE